MVRETRVSKNALVYPLFIRAGTGAVEASPSLDGQSRCTADRLPFLLKKPVAAGVASILLFGIPDHKDETGSSAWDDEGSVQKAVREVKRVFPHLTVITDVCLCEYTSHGHCGVVKGGAVQNDETLPLLARTALSHAQAGADIVAPSDMMDGRVGAIRKTLDEQGFKHTAILSYAVKYASAFYGPFRDAAGSAPAFGDRKGYQMDPHNAREALREARLDTAEGADILMVKPALPYLDILYRVAAASLLPVAAYSVSGEYAMLRAAARAGLLDERRAVSEAAVSIFRAGARFLITYYAPQLAKWIDEGRLG
jgi:porphobilinogen synthase